MKYLIITLIAFLSLSVAIAYNLYEKNRIVKIEMKEAKANYELIKAHIEFQNEHIRQANEQLKGYEKQIAEIELNYKIKIDNLKGQIAKIKTCEDSDIYFKGLLQEIEKARK